MLVSEPLGVLLGVEPWNWRWSSSRLRKHRAGRDGFHIKIEELLHDDRALVITQIRDRAG